MIVRVMFTDGVAMMFGASYKPWTLQFDEYCWNYKKQLADIKHVQASDEKWVGWGGLKWCPEENFQNQLNREGCQSSDPDNPNPRQYKSMSFYHDSKIEKIATIILRDCRNNRTDHDLVYRGKLPKGA